jgi:hypothetical protein
VHSHLVPLLQKQNKHPKLLKHLRQDNKGQPKRLLLLALVKMMMDASLVAVDSTLADALVRLLHKKETEGAETRTELETVVLPVLWASLVPLQLVQLPKVCQ